VCALERYADAGAGASVGACACVSVCGLCTKESLFTFECALGACTKKNLCGEIIQCVAECVAVCCSVLQCVAVCCSRNEIRIYLGGLCYLSPLPEMARDDAACYNLLQCCVAVGCAMLQAK